MRYLLGIILGIWMVLMLVGVFRQPKVQVIREHRIADENKKSTRTFRAKHKLCAASEVQVVEKCETRTRYRKKGDCWECLRVKCPASWTDRSNWFHAPSPRAWIARRVDVYVSPSGKVYER